MRSRLYLSLLVSAPALLFAPFRVSAWTPGMQTTISREAARLSPWEED